MHDVPAVAGLWQVVIRREIHPDVLDDRVVLVTGVSALVGPTPRRDSGIQSRGRRRSMSGVGAGEGNRRIAPEACRRPPQSVFNALLAEIIDTAQSNSK